MPTYAYACTECDHTFEIVQPFSEDSLTVCPECGGRLRKIFNAVGVVFKGGGFYRTDSRSSGKKPAGASSANGSTGSDGSSGSSANGSGGSSTSSTAAGSSSSSGASSTTHAASSASSTAST